MASSSSARRARAWISTGTTRRYYAVPRSIHYVLIGLRAARSAYILTSGYGSSYRLCIADANILHLTGGAVPRLDYIPDDIIYIYIYLYELIFAVISVRDARVTCGKRRIASVSAARSQPSQARAQLFGASPPARSHRRPKAATTQTQPTTPLRTLLVSSGGIGRSQPCPRGHQPSSPRLISPEGGELVS